MAKHYRDPQNPPDVGLLRRMQTALDPWIVAPAFIIFAISLVALYSVVYHPVALETEPGIDFTTYFTRQFLWGFFGIGLMFWAAFRNVRKLEHSAWMLYVAGALLLASVLFFGVKVRNIRAWISLGFMTFQPSELVKIVVTVALARFFSSYNTADKPIRGLLISSLIVGLPAALVLAQPDMGTVIVYGSLLLTVPFAAGLPLSYFSLIVLSGALAGGRLVLGVADEFLQILPSGPLDRLVSDNAIAFRLLALSVILGLFVTVMMKRFRIRNAFIILLFFVAPATAYLGSFEVAGHLKEYQKQRLFAFIAPEIDPKGSGYNLIQSQIAFGSGGVIGKGVRGATQSMFGFLPERQTDFIFSVIGEIFGFFGAATVIVCFLILVVRILLIAARAPDRFQSLLAIGFATILMTHVVINIGMTLGLLPIMGIPLPFASYGGTSIVTAFLMLGIILSMERTQRV